MKSTTSVFVSVLCAFLAATLAGCPRGADQDAAGQPPADGDSADGADEARDEVAWALGHENPDVSQFALLAIATYRLAGYEDQLRAMAADNAVASLALAAVYHDGDAPYEYFAGQPPGRRIGDVLGAAYGLGCARLVPAAAWQRLLDAAEEAELSEFAWGLAQLDIEPGGPLQRSEGLRETLAQLRDQAVTADDTRRRGALDALLGEEAGAVDWQLYEDYLPVSHWNSVQWAALLRWAPEEVWQRLLGDSAAHEAIQLELGRALVLAGPTAIGLPGSEARLTTMGLGLEYRAVQFAQGNVETMALPELEVLAGDSDLFRGEESEDDRFRRQAYQLALADVLRLTDYALLLGDARLIERLIATLPELAPQARSGILAAIRRRDPAALSDAQLARLVKLEDRGVSYFLLEGWYDRDVVQQSDAAELVDDTPGHENTILVYAYRKWLEQQ